MSEFLTFTPAGETFELVGGGPPGPQGPPGPAGGGATATTTTFTPTGGIAATNVQAALAEVDSEKISNPSGTTAGFLKRDAGGVTYSVATAVTSTEVSVTAVGAVGAGTLQAAITTLEGLIASGGSATTKIDKIDTRTVTGAARRLNLNYTVATSDPNLSEVAINSKVVSWDNEWGALRGRVPYTGYADALVRAIIETGDFTGSGGAFGNAMEIIDRRIADGPARQRWGRRWADGGLVREGNLLPDTYIQAHIDDPIPAWVLAMPSVVILTLSSEAI